MTPGIFIGLVADATGCDIGTLATLHKEMVAHRAFSAHDGSGYSMSPVSNDDICSFLVAICMVRCGMGARRAAMNVRLHGNELIEVNKALASQTEYRFVEAGTSGLTKCGVISAAAIRRIFGALAADAKSNANVHPLCRA